MATILIIDDSSYMRGKIIGILKPGGHRIIEADNGLKGLQMAASNAPDCILLDIIMPGMDGFKILQALRDKGSSIPMIVITADIQESTHRQCFELGAFSVINKPPSQDELIETVNRALNSVKEGEK